MGLIINEQLKTTIACRDPEAMIRDLIVIMQQTTDSPEDSLFLQGI
jgi:hypothetical protein